MRKFIVFPIICLLLLYVSSFKSFDLGNGYRLQGFYGQHGWLFKSYYLPVVTGNIMGIQGCKNQYISGWIGGEPDLSFLVDTTNGDVNWYSHKQMHVFLTSVGCPAQDLNREVNMVGLSMGKRFTEN